MSQHDPNRLDPEWSQFMCAVKSKQLVFTTSAHSMRMRKGAGGTKRESGIHGHDWKTERTAGWKREGAQHAACSPVCEPGVVTPRVMEPGSLTRDISYVVSTLAGSTAESPRLLLYVVKLAWVVLKQDVVLFVQTILRICVQPCDPRGESSSLETSRNKITRRTS
jgi:hypothetical protein